MFIIKGIVWVIIYNVGLYYIILNVLNKKSKNDWLLLRNSMSLLSLEFSNSCMQSVFFSLFNKIICLVVLVSESWVKTFKKKRRGGIG